ncbi:hypothetical protein Ahy_B06g083560 [Arachis hypogaea]|uniref:Uncharacterized protein n=1 Tax=Arachis hypogaea TaxID=3818 RepID=A0A444YQ14_ARAHY|nr:hypothetical protein Ahy_B06g083560 [Arachis hypogaea]
MFESRSILCCHCLAVFPYYRVDRVPSCYVLPRGSKNVRCKYTYIKSNHDENRSDERHNLVRGLCSRFFNVAQDFVTCDEEANTLHSGLDELFDYHSNLGSKSVAPTQNSMVTQYEFALGADNIRGPSKVATKGRPRSKRLGSKLDSSTKKSMRRKKKNAPPVCVYHLVNFEFLVEMTLWIQLTLFFLRGVFFLENDVVANQNVAVGSVIRVNESQEHGKFMSLLNLFGNNI